MKITLTIATVITYLLFALWILIPDYAPKTEEGYISEEFHLIFEISTYSVILMSVLIVVYIFYVVIANSVPKEKRKLWGWLIFFGNLFVIPFFWYFYVFKQMQSNQSLHSTPKSGASEA
jgi:hypothetical protein